MNPGGCWGFPEGSSKATGNPARVLGRCWRMFGPGGQVASRRCARVLSGPARSWIKFVGTFGDGALNYVRVCQNQKIIILGVPEGSGGVLGPLGGVLGPWGELRKTSPHTHTDIRAAKVCIHVSRPQNEVCVNVVTPKVCIHVPAPQECVLANCQCVYTCTPAKNEECATWVNRQSVYTRTWAVQPRYVYNCRAPCCHQQKPEHHLETRILRLGPQ